MYKRDVKAEWKGPIRRMFKTVEKDGSA